MPALLFHAYQQEAEGLESNLYCYEKLRGKKYGFQRKCAGEIV